MIKCISVSNFHHKDIQDAHNFYLVKGTIVVPGLNALRRLSPDSPFDVRGWPRPD